MTLRGVRNLSASSVWLLALLLLAWGARAETLLVGAASSLREVVDAAAARFEAVTPGTRIQVSYGASSVLAAQLLSGAPLDLLLLADPQIARSLEGADATVFARNRLVVLVREGAPNLASPAALALPRIRRFAIPAAAVPVGRYAREWLARYDLLDALEARAVQTEHARATLLAVDQGHVDAAIVYATDARLARRARIGYRIPDAEQPAIEYVAVVSPQTPEAELARRWLAFVAGPEGAAILASAGFLSVGATGAASE